MSTNPIDYVQAYGGKAGGWFFLRDKGGFNLNLLPNYFIEPDQDSARVLSKIPNSDLPDDWLVRLSHPNDHEGFVDILDTERVRAYSASPKKALELLVDKVEELREKAQNPEIFKFSDYEGQPYDGKVRVMVQPYNDGERGSVVEHPHEKGTYIIDITDPSKKIGKSSFRMERWIVKNGKVVDYSGRLKPNDFHVENIIAFYERIKDSGYCDANSSFQLEFGFNSRPNRGIYLFYQARPFLPFKNPEFEIEDEDAEYTTYGCFGMTPESGLLLPFVKSTLAEELNEIKHDFAWAPFNLTDRLGPDVRPKKMKVFSPVGGRDSLEHNKYRWIRKAEVSILNTDYTRAIHFHFDLESRIKFISNGLKFTLNEVE